MKKTRYCVLLLIIIVLTLISCGGDAVDTITETVAETEPGTNTDAETVTETEPDTGTEPVSDTNPTETEPADTQEYVEKPDKVSQRFWDVNKEKEINSLINKYLSDKYPDVYDELYDIVFDQYIRVIYTVTQICTQLPLYYEELQTVDAEGNIRYYTPDEFTVLLEETGIGYNKARFGDITEYNEFRLYLYNFFYGYLADYYLKLCLDVNGELYSTYCTLDYTYDYINPEYTMTIVNDSIIILEETREYAPYIRDERVYGISEPCTYYSIFMKVYNKWKWMYIGNEDINFIKEYEAYTGEKISD